MRAKGWLLYWKSQKLYQRARYTVYLSFKMQSMLRQFIICVTRIWTPAAPGCTRWYRWGWGRCPGSRGCRGNPGCGRGVLKEREGYIWFDHYVLAIYCIWGFHFVNTVKLIADTLYCTCIYKAEYVYVVSIRKISINVLYHELFLPTTLYERSVLLHFRCACMAVKSQDQMANHRDIVRKRVWMVSSLEIFFDSLIENDGWKGSFFRRPIMRKKWSFIFISRASWGIDEERSRLYETDFFFIFRDADQFQIERNSIQTEPSCQNSSQIQGHLWWFIFTYKARRDMVESWSWYPCRESEHFC